MLKKIRKFTKHLSKGLKQELRETADIPKNIKQKEYKKAVEQVGDIGKMTFLSFLWVLPGGGVLSGILVKFSKKIRPSAFRKEEKEKKC